MKIGQIIRFWCDEKNFLKQCIFFMMWIFPLWFLSGPLGLGFYWLDHKLKLKGMNDKSNSL